jgi:hypothetical protein
MLVKVNDLAAGPALDWAVAKCQGCTFKPSGILDGLLYATAEKPTEWLWLDMFRPSVDWSTGGPIIERERIEVRPGEKGVWYASIFGVWMFMPGFTPLMAAMRCYVASKLGAEIDIPEELLK